MCGVVWSGTGAAEGAHTSLDRDANLIQNLMVIRWEKGKGLGHSSV